MRDELKILGTRLIDAAETRTPDGDGYIRLINENFPINGLEFYVTGTIDFDEQIEGDTHDTPGYYERNVSGADIVVFLQTDEDCVEIAKDDLDFLIKFVTR